jgi:microcin C transport system substrate-binding protein
MTKSHLLEKSRISIAAFATIAAMSIGLSPVQAETIITTHAFSDLGQIKYAADFKHLDYVNPDAPKGGEISASRPGNFDSVNPYSRKGRAAALSVLPFERLMDSTSDDTYGSYCLVSETL